jgi:sortase A
MSAARESLATLAAATVAGMFFLFGALPASSAPPVSHDVSAGRREQDVPAYEPVSSSEPSLGRIEIPRVGISSVILQGVDYETIRRAVGHFPATPLPFQSGNMALAAHRTTDFYGLRNIRIGDTITITCRKRTFRYRVERMWVVSPNDVSVLAPTPDKSLTLVTCYPFDYHGSAPERFIVRARALEADDAATTRSAASVAPALPTAAVGSAETSSETRDSSRNSS